MNGNEFLSDIRNATITTAALKLMRSVLEEHLECLSEGGEGTKWGSHLYEDLKVLTEPMEFPNSLFCVFLHLETIDTLKDWKRVMMVSEHVEYDNQLEETFALESIKEKP
jgi:hypothetical protein